MPRVARPKKEQRDLEIKVEILSRMKLKGYKADKLAKELGVSTSGLYAKLDKATSRLTLSDLNTIFRVLQFTKEERARITKWQ